MAQAAKLGELAAKEAGTTHPQLRAALEQQASSGERLGEILVNQGIITPLQLRRLLAHQLDMPLVDISSHLPDASLLAYDDIHTYCKRAFVPWRMNEGTLVLACADPSDDFKTWAQSQYGAHVQFVLTSPRDVLFAIEHWHGKRIEHEVREELAERTPHYSAKRTLFGHQRIWMGALALLAAFCLTLYPQATLIAGLCVINLFYLGTMLFKLLLFMIGLRQNKWHHTQDRIITPNRASKLPIYTLLVPLYRERESVPRMISAIRALEYPKSRLDVKLIVEADDDETIQAIKDARPPGYFELIRVPYSLPRTKPKACNYALKFARGEYVTIYDAEDQPAPNQLRQALRAFEKAPDNVVCLQAKLNYYNRLERPITQLFAIEYSALFDFTLPGLENLGMPIPLGGTSNHIHLQKLREVGAWDPYNVTEDADLGIRLWLHGYRTRVLGSITLEEAPITLGAWIRQRSRWIKGYMQTWLVYMRNPLELLQTVGWKAFMGFQLFIGGPCLVFLLAPFLWGLCAVWLAGGLPESFIPDWLVASCIAVLAVGLASHVLYALAIARIHQWFGMTAGIALYPLYWLLHSVASFKALWQLIRRPHYWEKTRHATTKLPAHQIMAAMRSHPEGQ